MKGSLSVLVRFSPCLTQQLSPERPPSSLMTSTQVLHRLGATHWETGPQRAASIERNSQTIFPTLTRSSPLCHR
jgi:hypothetical protein